jgi:uncharacterized membrane protein
LQEDPHDWLAIKVDQFGDYLVFGKHGFPEIYLFFHGILNVLLVIAMWRKQLWAYPTAVVIFATFIIYQFYRFSNTHSLVLLLVSIWDVVVILLTVSEYRRLMKNKSV